LKILYAFTNSKEVGFQLRETLRESRGWAPCFRHRFATNVVWYGSFSQSWCEFCKA